jgi:hypothetical protein
VAVSYQDVPDYIGTKLYFEAREPVGNPNYKKVESNRWEFVETKKRIVARAIHTLFPSKCVLRQIDFYRELD